VSQECSFDSTFDAASEVPIEQPGHGIVAGNERGARSEAVDVMPERLVGQVYDIESSRGGSTHGWLPPPTPTRSIQERRRIPPGRLDAGEPSAREILVFDDLARVVRNARPACAGHWRDE